MQCAAVAFRISHLLGPWFVWEIFRPGLVCSAPPVYVQRAGLSDVSITQLSYAKISLKSGGKERAGSCRRMTSHWNPMKSKFCFFATFKLCKYTVYVVDLSIWEFPLLVPDAWENPTCSRRCWCHCGSGRTSRCSAVWGCWHDVAFVGMQDIWSLHMSYESYESSRDFCLWRPFQGSFPCLEVPHQNSFLEFRMRVQLQRRDPCCIWKGIQKGETQVITVNHTKSSIRIYRAAMMNSRNQAHIGRQRTSQDIIMHNMVSPSGLRTLGLGRQRWRYGFRATQAA